MYPIEELIICCSRWCSTTTLCFLLVSNTSDTLNFFLVLNVGCGRRQYVRLTVGAVKTQSKIIRGELNPEWNQVFAVGRDKIHGGTLELTVWDAVPIPSLSFSFPFGNSETCTTRHHQSGFWFLDEENRCYVWTSLFATSSSMYAQNVVLTLGFAKCPWIVANAVHMMLSSWEITHIMWIIHSVWSTDVYWLST